MNHEPGISYARLWASYERGYDETNWPLHRAYKRGEHDDDPLVAKHLPAANEHMLKRAAMNKHGGRKMLPRVAAMKEQDHG